jgi:hypothetical protein
LDTGLYKGYVWLPHCYTLITLTQRPIDSDLFSTTVLNPARTAHFNNVLLRFMTPSGSFPLFFNRLKLFYYSRWQAISCSSPELSASLHQSIWCPLSLSYARFTTNDDTPIRHFHSSNVSVSSCFNIYFDTNQLNISRVRQETSVPNNHV